MLAPTDEAFAALEEGVLDDLLRPGGFDQLTAVLTHHVLVERILAEDLESGKVTTARGDEVKIKVRKGTVRIDEATVIITDVQGSNGVIHGIDAVLMP